MFLVAVNSVAATFLICVKSNKTVAFLQMKKFCSWCKKHYSWDSVL